ncbi:cytochrome c oxidase assembly protein [Henriciella mobilis]|uniref:Cytochrome c oxidase assembly protein CtaG n=1 Tax=Henriciella mobilis TaxID=2305467 RepID=A0A399RDL5_9PROT|nr:cytochrome c oxidase assembly protein [Henriciella mobilis]RIJ15539.1 cytochrome c oxidase assembly protein [Henriciella mobilis]RIJ19003.1 cytochrome c oxidase assembly protein [Henriciella mobilis]RIJ28005.1 cytochrome c oxidase assembly protein [Henriciella mobilis]
MTNSTKTLLITVVAALGMLGLAFASKPLYDTFCRVTGFGGTTQIAEAAPEDILDRHLNIRFDANVIDAPVLFRPLQTSMDIKVGEHGLAFYEVSNTSKNDVSLMASYNVTPHKAGLYFNKLECFCFTERIVKAGETKKLPVVFFISPDLDRERNMDDVRTITLSYTFYQTDSFEGAANSAALN